MKQRLLAILEKISYVIKETYKKYKIKIIEKLLGKKKVKKTEAELFEERNKEEMLIWNKTIKETQGKIGQIIYEIKDPESDYSKRNKRLDELIMIKMSK